MRKARVHTGWLSLALVFLATLPARAFDICAMDEESAYKSPQCVRYLFECTIKDDSTFKSLNEAELSPIQRLRLQYLEIAAIAAKKCEQYSYQEAEAALNAKLRSLSSR